jgi:hypothetical protein
MFFSRLSVGEIFSRAIKKVVLLIFLSKKQTNRIGNEKKRKAARLRLLNLKTYERKNSLAVSGN